MNDILKINSISDLHSVLGYEKPEHPLITVVDFSKITTNLYDLENRIVLGFYCIMLKEECTGEIKYGREYYDFQEGTLLFTSPGQSLFIEQTNESLNFEGWGLFFHQDLIRKSALGAKIKEYTFFSYNINEALHISEKEKATINDITKKIEQEYSMNIDDHSQDLIVSNIELLLNYCKRFYRRQFITRKSSNSDITTRFEQFITEYIDSKSLKTDGIPTVGFCAEHMCLSPNYLSDLLKKETGKNTQDHIHFTLLEKAKTMLLNSNATVSEIAYDLGFEYPQYFSKLFKKKTGISPVHYRDTN